MEILATTAPASVAVWQNFWRDHSSWKRRWKLLLRRSRTGLAGDQRDPGAANLAALLSPVAGEIDIGPILQQWTAAKELFTGEQRHLPQPLWARRGFEHDGGRAWRELVEQVRSLNSNRAMSAYLHVPFCDRRCGFCDCYSFSLRRRSDPTQELFVAALETEMEAWAELGGLSGRPVTTVHFGGGTPTILRTDLLRRLVLKLRQFLAVTLETEWALESASSLLDEQHLVALGELGFTRLHVGVQTLEDHIRQVIGRLEPSHIVIEKLANALAGKFVVSVDVIYGLPGQTVTGLLETLGALVETGVHGFSLYQLQTGARNRRFLAAIGALTRPALSDYAMFQAAEQYLRRCGYRKNHFAHFAREGDGNLYYRHAARGEDLLALGPVADGVLESYHYRHCVYQDYMRKPLQATPRLEGGVRETREERCIQRAVAHLMAGSISQAMLAEMGAERLLSVWSERGMVEAASEPGWFTLTANGSWFLTALICELEQAGPKFR